MISKRRAPTPSQPLHPQRPTYWPCGRVEKHRMRCLQQTDGQQEATTEEPPDLHQLVHQRLWTPLAVNSKTNTPTDKLHVAKGCCFRVQIEWSMVSSHVPSAARYPRHGAGRKGAYGVAMRWRQRHPCLRHHDEHRGRDRGTGQEQDLDKKSVPHRGAARRSGHVRHGRSQRDTPTDPVAPGSAPRSPRSRRCRVGFVRCAVSPGLGPSSGGTRPARVR